MGSTGHDAVEEIKNVKTRYSVSWKETPFTNCYLKKELTIQEAGETDKGMNTALHG